MRKARFSPVLEDAARKERTRRFKVQETVPFNVVEHFSQMVPSRGIKRS